MKRYIILLMTLVCTMTAMAEEQPDTVIITLQNGSEVRYTSDQFDRVQIIFNLQYGVKVYLKNGKSKDYLATKVEIAQYKEGGEVIVDNNKNRNRYRAKLLEYPHLAADSTMNQLVIKSTPDYGITYSLEWSYRDMANRWTCYQMHSGNMEINADRSKNFYPDPDIPEQYRTIDNDYKKSGFSRGHLCPSADRRCSEDQNQQTFYLSNIQPQYQAHNDGIWLKLENKIRDWAADCDTLYVVKAATIRSDQLLPEKCIGSSKRELIVPKYFYMAVLAYDKKTDKYRAMGLWTLHQSERDSNTNLGDYAITIDRLEELTGIDFFCNLPDDKEDEVERGDLIEDGKWVVDVSLWGITKSQ